MFNVGDRVSYNGHPPYSSMPHGILGTVIEVSRYGYGVNVKWDTEGIELHHPGYLTLVETPQDAPLDTPVEEEPEYYEDEDEVFEDFAKILRQIYDERTAGEYTFSGVLAHFLRLIDAVRVEDE